MSTKNIAESGSEIPTAINPTDSRRINKQRIRILFEKVRGGFRANNPFSRVTELKKVEEEDLGLKLQSLERQFGTRELTFEEATALVSTLAQLHTLKVGSLMSPEAIVGSTLIVDSDRRQEVGYLKSTKYTTQKNHFASPAIAKLLHHYPQLRIGKDITEQMALDISSAVADGGTHAQVIDGKVFLYLDPLNSPISVQYGFLTNKKTQFRSLEESLSREPATAFSNFVNSYLHEVRHLEALNNKNNVLDSEIITAHERLFQFRDLLDRTPIQGTKDGFRFHLYSNGKEIELREGDKFTQLDEFVVDFLRVKEVLDLGISATVAYGNSDDYLKFEQMLKRVGISHQELESLHRTANLKEFLLRIAYGLNKDKFQTAKQALEWAYEIIFSVYSIPHAIDQLSKELSSEEKS